jgi:phage shock protein A
MKLTKPLHTGGKHELGWTMKRWELELVADFIINREQAIRSELAQSIEYQDSLHEKIAKLEAEVDCRILLSEHNRQIMELERKISEARKVLEEANKRANTAELTIQILGIQGDAIDKALEVLK